MKVSKDLIISKLNDIIVPEANKPVSQYIKELNIDNNKINLKIDLDKKSSPLKKSLEKVVTNVLSDLTKEYELNLSVTAEKLDLQNLKLKLGEPENPLDKVKNIIAVASGKGGVGKSTVSTNLAIALAKTGAKVGLLDADVYGPSIPTMFGLKDQKPMAEKIGEKDYIIPFEKYGVKLISIGFFIKEDDALIWRGAMATSAIKQLINDVKWGDLDYFVIDLPPGTGDVPLTMVQTIPVTGAVVVTTPQEVAVIDVMKSIKMFKTNKIEVPVLGIVENMAWFTPADAPDKKYHIFGKNGGKKLAEKFNLDLLGQMPLVENMVENADNGKPAVVQEGSVEAKYMSEIAENVIKKVEERNKNIEPTKIVPMSK